MKLDGDANMVPLTITPENINTKVLKEMFDSAYMECQFDKDGDLVVTESGLHIFVVIGGEKNQYIKFMAMFGSNEKAKRSELLEYVNRINTEFVMTRAALIFDGKSICYDHFIFLAGGVTPSNVVQSLKRFASIPAATVTDKDRNLFRD